MKNFIKKSVVIALLLSSTFVAKAQVKIGDNPTTINAGSVLELESTNKGLMMPRISLTSTTVWGLLGTATAGMTVYNTNAAMTSGSTSYPSSGIGEYYWDGTGWVAKKGSVAGSGFTQSIYGAGGNFPLDWTFNSWVNIAGPANVTVPRDGYYLIIGAATVVLPGVINASFNAYGKGLLGIYVDGVNEVSVDVGAVILNDNGANVNYTVNTNSSLFIAKYLTKGPHTIYLGGRINVWANVASVSIINPTLILVATGE